MIEKIKEILERQRQLEEELASPAVTGNQAMMEKLGREYRGLKKNIPSYLRYMDVVKNIAESKDILKTETDPEIQGIAKEDLALLEQELPALDEKVKYLLVPRDPLDAKDAILEIRAGTGGIEAGIFAADLYRMYSHFFEKKNWTAEVLSSSYGDIGAIKEIVIAVKGEEVYGTLKYESGVHRVQRVPQTEAQGRVHTSAASVVVFPEADDVDVYIDPMELRIDVFRAGGKGGQHVNKTESAVRIVHLPTGITVQCQDEKSQLKNKAQAMKILTSRILDARISEKQALESATRKTLVGSGDRSEKIRTYNFPQNRFTDHRIGLTLYKLEAIINGDLFEVVDSLVKADLNEQLKTTKSDS